jgi:hypothetical protein
MELNTVSKKITPPPTEHEPRWARNAALARYLAVTTMTIWNWRRNPKLVFPQPTVINSIEYTDLNAVDAWMRDHVVNRVKKLEDA